MSTKKEFSSLSMVLTLVIVCACAALALAAVQEATRERIAQARLQGESDAVGKVLPRFGNEPAKEAFEVQIAGGGSVKAYPGRDAQGRLVGLAVAPVDPKGYGGPIQMMVGLDPDGKIVGVQVLKMTETPGLGDGIAKESFLKPFEGKGFDTIRWKVKKDGGDVDAITAATISSRAAVRAIVQAFETFDEAKKQGKLD